ncbi:ULBP3, partial [Cervus elaphus hippelaphus]
AHSLSYHFTIDPQTRGWATWSGHPGQPWCVVQGQVDGEVFLSYDCGRSKIKYTSPFSPVEGAGLGGETRARLGRPRGSGPSGGRPSHPAGQDDMPVWREWTHQWILAVWFQWTNVLFDSENGHWIAVHSGGRQMKEKWENDRAVTDFFKKVSMGDWRAWLQDFLVHWEKILKTT